MWYTSVLCVTIPISINFARDLLILIYINKFMVDFTSIISQCGGIIKNLIQSSCLYTVPLEPANHCAGPVTGAGPYREMLQRVLGTGVYQVLTCTGKLVLLTCTGRALRRLVADRLGVSGSTSTSLSR